MGGCIEWVYRNACSGTVLGGETKLQWGVITVDNVHVYSLFCTSDLGMGVGVWVWLVGVALCAFHQNILVRTLDLTDYLLPSPPPTISPPPPATLGNGQDHAALDTLTALEQEALFIPRADLDAFEQIGEGRLVLSRCSAYTYSHSGIVCFSVFVFVFLSVRLN